MVAGTESEMAAEQMTRSVSREPGVETELKSHIANYGEVVNEARDATQLEQTMTFMEAVRLYPKAIGWSLLLSTAIIMEGYDVVLLGSFYAYPTFVKKYGNLQADGTYNIPARWQTGLSEGAQCGEIIGLFINGIVSERYGYKKTMIVSLFLMICFIFIPFFSQNLRTLLVGEILQGIPWGVFQTLTVSYASEVCPVALRAYLTTYVNLCWVIGQFLASGVLRGLLGRTDEWSYRIPFAVQWIWPLPILIGTCFAPESPWWLVRHGRIDAAKRALRRLTSRSDTSFDPDKTIAMIIHTNEMEKAVSAGTSYWDCFKGVDLRRTEIACVVWSIQNLCGSAFMGYSTYFLEQAGLPTVKAFDLSLGQYAIGIVGTVSSWFLMRHHGRRTLYIGGLICLSVLLLIIGFMGIAPSTNKGASYAVGAMLLLYTFTYDITIGPVCYCLVAEVSSTRLRAKTVVLARNLYNVFGIMNGVITPYMLNTDQLNWKAKTGFFWCGVCLLCLVWTYFRLPEPRGRTYGELDVLFEARVSARNFAKTHADQFATHGRAVEKDTPEIEYAEKV